MTAVTSDRADYIITVRRVDGATHWVYPPLTVTAASVRGALTQAAIAPLDHWHELTKEKR